MSFFLNIVSDDPLSLMEIESIAIEHRLKEFNWHMSKTADSLNITRTTLRMKMRAYNINQREQIK